MRSATGGGRRWTSGVVALIGCLTAALLGACTAEPATPSQQAVPPAPPAACMLDQSELTATTGLAWTPDQSTATDTRCVYDPAGNTGPAGFLAVDVTTSTDDAASQLDTIGELCQSGSRADVEAGDAGFVCRFDGTGVYAAIVQGGRVVTVATSAVPPGTSVERLALALNQQLTAIGRP